MENEKEILNMINQLDKQDFELSSDIKLLFDEIKNIEDKNDVSKVESEIISIKESIDSISLQKGDKGDDGKDYVLTDSDKKEISELVVVPVVEKVIEKVETIKELPIITNEIKEVAKYENAEKIVEKINTLENVIDIKTIKDFPKIEGNADIKRQVDTIGNQVLRLMSKQTQSVDLSGYVPTTRTLTINGATFDLSANRTWTIAVPTKTSDLTNDSGFITSASLAPYELLANKDIDGTLASNSDTKYASQKATKTYADTKLSKAGGTMTGAFTTATSALSDGANVAVNASLANIFTLTAAGNRTIDPPTNAVNGQRITIYHKASGADRTLTLSTSAGGFIFGTDITALTATASGLTDLIGCEYNSTISKWLVVAYVKGFTI